MKKSKTTKAAKHRCFKCSAEVTQETGKAVDFSTGEPKPFIQMKAGDGVICNDCEATTSTEIIRRDWLKSIGR